MPSVVSMRNWCASTNHGRAPFKRDASAANAQQDAAPRGAASTPRIDRLEPALDAAVQRVVFDRLPVRALRRRARTSAPRRRSSHGAGADSGRRRAGAHRAASASHEGSQRVELGRRVADAKRAKSAGASTRVPALGERRGERRRAACRSRPSARSSPLACRASAAPLPSAASLASATSRRIGAMPQFVHGKSRSAGT